ncbi:MAG TPA: TIR domain-containing protein, partial [Pirellulales bacterium]|nr:TIR domain-containing protein [Pirellulales bacterium]
YTERDRILLEHFATQAAVAIRNAQLVASLLMHSGMYASYRDTEGLVARMDELQQAARTEQLTVLVADMRGFTQLCQTLANPALVQERLSAFLSMLSDAVLEHDGLVNKFLGDGVLALFRGGDYSERAVRCAFAMVEKFEGMKDDWNDEANEQLDFLDIGVGITTDEVIVGGIGTGAVRDFTAIGNAVNLATAFEREARDGRHIICDRATYRRAKKELAEVVDLEDFVLQKPGQSFGVKYKRYQLVAPQSPPRVFISHSHADDDYVLNELVPRLTELGIHTWHSGHDIRNGSLWTAEIRKGIADCNWMLVVVSKHAASSKWVRREVDLALAIGHLDERVVSLIMDDTPLKDVNEYLAALQGIDARQHKDIAEILARAFVNAN